MTKAIEKKSAALVAAAFKKLPQKLTCPKCRRTQSKDAFGMRVLKRDASAIAVVAGRQSYCTSCRSKPKAR